MSNRTFPLSDALNTYLQQVGLREPAVMQALRLENQQHNYGKMQTPPEQALLLQFLTRLLGVRRYLEIGVFTGYSVLAVGLAMPEDGKIVGCDRRPDFAEIAYRYWEQAGIAHKVELILQPARDTLAALGEVEPFELIYIDADKANYPYYYERALQLLTPGGVIALDNMLSAGRVITPLPAEPPSVTVIRELNQFIHTDTRVEMVMLPIGDGLTLLRKK
jgi:predicted O-methyltransferase YrrM